MNALVGYGMYEIETFSFYSRKAFDAVNLPENDPLRNALVISTLWARTTSIMRTTALPSMMDVIARNYNARAAECALFEDTTTYTPNADPDQLPTETETLMLGAYGAGWDYLGLKGVVEKLLETARVADARFARNTAGTSYHPGRCADIWLGEDKLGTIGEVHPAVLANYGVKPRVVARRAAHGRSVRSPAAAPPRSSSCPSTRPLPVTLRWWRTTPCPRQTSRRASVRLPEKRWKA